MSDDPPKPPRPPIPSPPNAPSAPKPPTAKTSSVPLKKETVRITLRAKPGEGDDAGAGAETEAPPAPAASPKPAPPAGSKTIPLSPASAPAEGGAPAAGKATVQLKTGAPTQSLPKATVQLQRTQPVSSAPPSATVGGARLQTSSFDVDDEDEPEGITPVAIAALVLSAILLIITLMGGDKVGMFVQKGGSPSWGVPEDLNKFDAQGGNIEAYLPEIPARSE